ncbi:unnamed protein product [marine sediment metagenome]|uniref:Uncharacterized protein n=1 Tax=marine sediment metagenome TaxID=412755 RepID=X1SFL5_9ZZZZ
MDIIQHLLKLISPALRELIVKYAQELKAYAQSTDNPIDDIAVWLLFLVIGLPWNSK